MALPLKPYQKLHPNPTKFSSILNANPTGPVHLIPKHFLPSLSSSSRSFTQIGQKCSSIFNAKPTGPYRPLSFSMVHLIPKPNPTVCPIRSLTQIDHECSSIFNAKPTGADQPLRFKRYLLLRFIQKQLHPNPTQMFEQLQCQNHQTSSVIQIQQAHRTISSLY